MIIYGIKNCDKVRAALKQVRADGEEVTLHDFRVDGISSELVGQMLQHIPFEKLLNKRSTTWKQLSDQQKQQAAAALLVEHPTLIKRPVVFDGDSYHIGLAN